MTVENQEDVKVDAQQAQSDQEALAFLNKRLGNESDAIEGVNEDGTEIDESLIGGKFKSQDDLLKAYEELQSKFSKGTQEEVKEEVKEDVKEDVKEEVKEEEIKEEATNNPELFKKIGVEVAKDGEVSEDTLKALEKQGINKDFVDSYIKGQQAIANNLINDIFDSVGGEQEYKELLKWADSTLDDKEKSAFDNLAQNIKSEEDVINLKRSLEFFQLKREASGGIKTTHISETSSSYDGVKAFQTMDEYVKMSNNPKYGQNEAYTALVDKRYLMSKNQGFF